MGAAILNKLRCWEAYLPSTDNIFAKDQIINENYLARNENIFDAQDLRIGRVGLPTMGDDAINVKYFEDQGLTRLGKKNYSAKNLKIRKLAAPEHSLDGVNKQNLDEQLALVYQFL